jgi:catechol 2,3-dioxygenase-like lactoylglutathione lyase family enzyme
MKLGHDTGISGYMPKTMDPAEYDWSRPVFDHVHLRVADLEASRSFYATVLEPLDVPLLLDTPELVQFANLALSADAEPSVGVHIAFLAASQDAVDAFHATALAAGYRDNGAPGPRAYGPYAAYVLDPDGNNVEAVHRNWVPPA